MIIWFNASDKMKVAFCQVTHQLSHLFTVFRWQKFFRLLWLFSLRVARKRNPLISLIFFFLFSEKVAKNFVFRIFHDVFYLIPEKIFIFLSEPDHRVVDFFGSVLDSEQSWRKIKIWRWKVFMFFVIVSEFSDKWRFVRGSYRTPFVK